MHSDGLGNTYTVSLFIKHEGSDSPSGIGTIPSLSSDLNRSPASTELVLGTGDGASRHWHDKEK